MRGLTLHQLKDTIHDVYLSKAKADARSGTLHQHQCCVMETTLQSVFLNGYLAGHSAIFVSSCLPLILSNDTTLASLVMLCTNTPTCAYGMTASLVFYCSFLVKLKHVCRALEQRQPYETMEQHLVSYLTTKYGMRQLIMQWLTSILAAVEHFTPLDANTALFGKVLRNEVEEQFHLVQQRVASSAAHLLQSILQVCPLASTCSRLLRYAFSDFGKLYDCTPHKRSSRGQAQVQGKHCSLPLPHGEGPSGQRLTGEQKMVFSLVDISVA